MATSTSIDNKAKSNSSIYSPLALLVALFAIRLINALTLKTFFQPDEFFQSLEPAWQTRFGQQSGAWLTWEWRACLRSCLHPGLFARVYSVANRFAKAITNSPAVLAEIMIAAPKVVQALDAAFSDLYTFLLAKQVYGSDSRASRAALALTLLSPWNWFCSTRTLSNSAETTLTATALYYWPWEWFILSDETKRDEEESKNDKAPSYRSAPTPPYLYLSLVFAAYACILRPTNILIWITLSIASLWPNRHLRKPFTFARAAAIVGSAVLALTTSQDVHFYGEWVFPPLRFLYFNVVQSLAIFYGRNRPDYYFTEGIYLLLTTATPFAVIGIWQALFKRADTTKQSREEAQIKHLLALPIMTSLIVFSLISHKEVRFIYPLLPMFHVLAAKPLATFFNPFPIPRQRYRHQLLCLAIALNLAIAYYTSYVHQRGVIDVMHYLRHEQEASFRSRKPADWSITVGFLMPCHSTPWRSHLVYPHINAWALTCEPPLGLSMRARENYLDEADVFYNNPVFWLDKNMEATDSIIMHLPSDYPQIKDASRRAWPQYLVFFEQLEPSMQSALPISRYRECWRGFNTHWHDDWRRQGDVIVWCLRG